MARFERYIGIDYSGAETPESSLKGLRVYLAEGVMPAVEAPPPESPRKYWTRQGVAEWLETELFRRTPALVGIDHGFSFPLQYFEQHRLPWNWDAFLEDFRQHWPTDRPYTYVDFVRDGMRGNGGARWGDTRWRRVTEERAGAKSVFHFDVPGSVAKSTHAGLPWLLKVRRRFGKSVHFWPFDGWMPAEGRSVVVEAYPALWSRGFDPEGRDQHQHDAYTIANWMQRADWMEWLERYFQPELEEADRKAAEIEGWIFGVDGKG